MDKFKIVNGHHGAHQCVHAQADGRQRSLTVLLEDGEVIWVDSGYMLVAPASSASCHNGRATLLLKKCVPGQPQVGPPVDLLISFSSSGLVAVDVMQSIARRLVFATCLLHDRCKSLKIMMSSATQNVNDSYPASKFTSQGECRSTWNYRVPSPSPHKSVHVKAPFSTSGRQLLLCYRSRFFCWMQVVARLTNLRRRDHSLHTGDFVLCVSHVARVDGRAC